MIVQKIWGKILSQFSKVASHSFFFIIKTLESNEQEGTRLRDIKCCFLLASSRYLSLLTCRTDTMSYQLYCSQGHLWAIYLNDSGFADSQHCSLTSSLPERNDRPIRLSKSPRAYSMSLRSSLYLHAHIIISQILCCLKKMKVQGSLQFHVSQWRGYNWMIK